MILYLLRDTDPIGGFLAAQERRPERTEERYTVREVRMVADFPDELWAVALAGGLPVDADRSNDSTWLRWWDSAAPVWAR